MLLILWLLLQCKSRICTFIVIVADVALTSALAVAAAAAADNDCDYFDMYDNNSLFC